MTKLQPLKSVPLSYSTFRIFPKCAVPKKISTPPPDGRSQLLRGVGSLAHFVANKIWQKA